MCPLSLRRTALAALIVAVTAGGAVAQISRIAGVVKDETGQPIKGATVRAENPNMSPRSFTASTDDKGRFSIIGMRNGQWSFIAEAPTFVSQAARMNVQTINPPLTFTLKRGAPVFLGVLGNVAAKDIQADLAQADQLFNARQWDQALDAYQKILAKVPTLSLINLQIAQIYRNKAKDVLTRNPPDPTSADGHFAKAIAAYNDVLKVDANNDKAKVGIGTTNFEKGDLDAAERMLENAAKSADATKEMFYGLGDVKLAKGKTDEAGAAYDRASKMDPKWGKPVLALGKIALKNGDKDGALKLFEKVVSGDPASPETIEANALILQLKQ